MFLKKVLPIVPTLSLVLGACGSAPTLVAPVEVPVAPEPNTATPSPFIVDCRG